MENFYNIIEQRIYESGYQHELSGAQIYDEICDEIEGKENGTYIFLVKKENDTIFEYKIDILDEQFNLSYIRITCGEDIYQAEFDS